MKKLCSLLWFVLICISQTFAQDIQEVVYLKNGSIIRGLIIEQIPNESLKIQTRDGNVFAYKMSEVQKITKETIYYGKKDEGRIVSPDARTNYKQKAFDEKSIYEYIKHFKPGFNGFMDLAYIAGIGEKAENRSEFTISLGVRPKEAEYLYAGIGAGIAYWFTSERLSTPIFAHVRGDIPIKRKFNPFADIKVGYSFWDLNGWYGSVIAGMRFKLTKTSAFNVGVGYQFQERYPIQERKPNTIYLSNHKKFFEGLIFRIGGEF